MKQIIDYGDERIPGGCAFCGGETGTRDHCPSRIFLDEPYPENLPVVPACLTCNSSFSTDEEYLACLISCIVAGSTEPDNMPRAKIKHIMSDKPLLQKRIEQGRSVCEGVVAFQPEHKRVGAVITKLAKGHALYELHEACTSTPESIDFGPLMLMSEEQLQAFEHPDTLGVWPEVGSRAMQRLISGADLVEDGWIIVQPERYRYHASVSSGIEIRIVIHEYLVGHVCWG